MKIKEPNPGSPGSPEAFASGCECPRMDNGNGRGAWSGYRDEDGDFVFFVSENCPIHGIALAIGLSDHPQEHDIERAPPLSAKVEAPLSEPPT